MIFLKTIYNHSLTVKTHFALSLGFIYIVYIVVEVTLNMAE